MPGYRISLTASILIVRWVLTIVCATGLFVAGRVAANEPEFAGIGVPFLARYCVECHAGEDAPGELSLEPFDDSQSVIRERQTFEKVLRVLAAGEMPPEDAPRPSVAEVEAFVEQVRLVWDYADRHAEPDPGRVTMRRLNRTEYRNTIRDLVGVEFDPAMTFPSDDIGHGFDNIGDVLTLSPLLMERYMDAAENIMELAITLVAPPVNERKTRAERTEPTSGELESLIVDGFRPLRTDGERDIDVGPIHMPYDWVDGEEYRFSTRVYIETESAEPLKVTVLLHGPELADPTPDAELDQLLGNVPRPAKILQTFEVRAISKDDAETLEVDVPLMPNRERMMVAIDKGMEGQPPAKLWVNRFNLVGPLNSFSASHRRLMAVTADTSPAERTREVLGRFLRKAYRRPVDPAELERSVRLVEQFIDADHESEESVQWASAIRFAMQAAICSPKFLFRVELDDRPTSLEPRALDEFQLASRLSYFLWSSMPDDELLDLAEHDQLTENIDQQVQRMLADPKASALVENFALQWLQLKRMDIVAPDAARFSSFNPRLRAAMNRETVLFFESIMREDRSLLDLIDANYTFLNKSLADHYDISETVDDTDEPVPIEFHGRDFQRVTLLDRRRGGLITQASVLTVTSNPTRTSPVKRGRWVLEQILGTPPPPPPPDVPELEEGGEEVTGGTLRQRLERHRKDPSCANCHAKMDPIGFALENYDAIGAFRTHDGEFEIDATGEFADGTGFSGPADLKAILLGKKDLFLRCLSEKMLTYAIGRGLEYHDRPTTDAIVQRLTANGYRFSVLVTEIAKSDPFRMRRGYETSASGN